MRDNDRSSNDPENPSWIKRMNRFISNTLRTGPKTRAQFNALLEEAKDNHLLNTEEFNIIEGAMDATLTHVRDVMVPRSQMITVQADSPPAQFLPQIIASGHSRFPVVLDNSDDVLGILLAKDLLPLILEHNGDAFANFNIHDYLRPVYKIPDSKRLNTLLKDFRENRNHMAIIIDEYGGVAGLITIEDVLEEIVGEIEDEFDVDEAALIKPIDNNDFIVKAHVTIDDFNAALSCALDNSEFDTIAGLVTQQFGHVPQRGETTDIEQFRFKVLHADKRRLYLLRATRR